MCKEFLLFRFSIHTYSSSSTSKKYETQHAIQHKIYLFIPRPFHTTLYNNIINIKSQGKRRRLSNGKGKTLLLFFFPPVYYQTWEHPANRQEIMTFRVKATRQNFSIVFLFHLQYYNIHKILARIGCKSHHNHSIISIKIV